MPHLTITTPPPPHQSPDLTPRVREIPLHLSKSVTGPQRVELLRFQGEIRNYWTAVTPEDEFRAFRLENGVYGIRFQKDIQMIRIKIPFGRLTADQLDAIANAAETYANGISHVTTRQAVQLHWVPLERIPQLLADLAAVGLTTREACGNTVRNVTACPEAGLNRHEPFDVNPYAKQFVQYFLRNPVSQNLPRKFKVAFSGCPEDCAKTAIHDLAFRATVRQVEDPATGVPRAVRGFRVYVGGGLGSTPKAAKQLTEFLPVEDLLAGAEAVIRVYDRLGNRKERHKARIKFLVEALGIEEFRRLWELEKKAVRSMWSGLERPLVDLEEFALRQTPVPAPAPLEDRPADGYDWWRQTNAKPQTQEGYFMAYLSLPAGDLDPGQVRAIAAIARRFGAAELRTTIGQNIMIPWIPEASLPAVHRALSGIGLGRGGVNQIANVVGCPGADTCNLALTKSHRLAKALIEDLGKHEEITKAPDLKEISIRVSGCPNSCGQHHIGSIGLFGGSKSVNGKPVPFYQMLLGGRVAEGSVQFGRVVARIPAKRVPEAVRAILELYRERRTDGETFEDWVHREEGTLVEKTVEPFAERAAA